MSALIVQIETWGSCWSGRVPLEGAEPELAMAFRNSTHAVFARGEEEPNTTRHVRVDLCIQHLEVHLEQRPKQHGHGNKIEEEPSRRREALRGEGRQRRKLVRLCQFAQQPDPEFSAEITRRPADGACQIGESARFRYSQPHQRDPFAVQTPVQQGTRGTCEALLDCCAGRHLTLELCNARKDVPCHHCGEQRPLVAETGIDRWLSRARYLGDLVDARAFKSALQKDLARRVEDAGVNLPGKFLRRAAEAHRGALCLRRRYLLQTV